MTGRAEQRDLISQSLKWFADGSFETKVDEGKSPLEPGQELVLTTDDGVKEHAVQVHVVVKSVIPTIDGVRVSLRLLKLTGSVLRVVSEVSHA